MYVKVRVFPQTNWGNCCFNLLLHYTYLGIVKSSALSEIHHGYHQQQIYYLNQIFSHILSTYAALDHYNQQHHFYQCYQEEKIHYPNQSLNCHDN